MKLALFSAALLATGIASAATPVNGWYTSVFGGYAYLPENIDIYRGARHHSNPSYDNGYNVGGRLGYQSNPIRYEFEYTYLHANAKQFKLNHFLQNGVEGNSTTNLLMANLYYDTPEILPTIKPFLGVGIGYAFIKNTLSSTGPFIPVSFSEKENSFAYQGTGGLTYNFAENFALNVSYRYIATSSKGRFGKIYQAQVADAGIIYRFDQCNYK